VDELQAAQHLVQEELVVLLRQVVVRLDHLVQVRLQQLEHHLRMPEWTSHASQLAQARRDIHCAGTHVDVTELAWVRRQQDVLDLHNVGVLQHAKQLDLAQYARGVLQRHSRASAGSLSFRRRQLHQSRACRASPCGVLWPAVTHRHVLKDIVDLLDGHAFACKRAAA
jgi:hypothetical protein